MLIFRGREPFWRGREYIFYAHSCVTFGLIEFQMGVVGIVGCYNGSRTRRTKKVENHCSMQICCFKKI